MSQLAYDMNVEVDDFNKNENVIVSMRSPDENTSRWMDWDAVGFLVTTGTNLVASVKPELQGIISEYSKMWKYSYWCFDTPSIYRLNEMLDSDAFDGKYIVGGQELCMSYIAETNIGVAEKYKLERFTDFDILYGDKRFWNCTCDTRKEDDRFGYFAKTQDNETKGACTISSDSKECWQIGVDVFSGERGKGIGKCLVQKVTNECLSLGKVPVYFVCWGNIASQNLAYSCGYRPVFSMLTLIKQ